MKGHRFKPQDDFACFIHRLNVFLKAARGTHRAQLAGRIDQHRNGVGNARGHPLNAGSKGSRVINVADADGAAVAIEAFVADIDIVTACGETGASSRAQCDIAAAGGVAYERVSTAGRVVDADGVVTERTNTVGRVVVASGVAGKRTSAGGRIAEARSRCL